MPGTMLAEMQSTIKGRSNGSHCSHYYHSGVDFQGVVIVFIVDKTYNLRKLQELVSEKLQPRE